MSSLNRWFDDLRSGPFYLQLRRLRWIVPVVVLILAAVHQTIVHKLVEPVSTPDHDWIELLIYSLTGSVVSFSGSRLDRRWRGSAGKGRSTAA